VNLRKYQEAVLNGSLCVKDSDRFVENTLGLAGETGEFADAVKKQIRDGVTTPMKLIDELGDVLWYLTFLSGQLGYSIEELATTNYEKLHKRHPLRYPDPVL
jgi:NTP pyrophosphatase (non-canonical NTP hydrolase)